MDYALIKNGVVEGVIVADADFVAGIASEWDHIAPASSGVGPSWKFENGEFLPPVQTDAPQKPTPTVWTVLTFRSRFTEGEKRAIYAARSNSIEIQIWLDDLAAAEDVRSDDPRMIAGLQGLEAAGLLPAGRAAEIMGAA